MTGGATAEERWAGEHSGSVAEVMGRWGAKAERLAACRWVLPVVVGIWCMANPTPMFGDPIRFARAGALLVQGRFDQIYAHPWMQAGPFELLSAVAIMPRADQHVADYVMRSENDLAAARFVIAAVITALLMAAVRKIRSWGRLSPSPMLELLVGLGVLFGDLPNTIWPGGHLAQPAITFHWLLAGLLLQRGRRTAAAVVIGLSAGWEPWGVLAAGMLVTTDPRTIIRDGGNLAAAAVLPYLPFVLTGHFELFHLVWPVAPGSLVHLIDPHATGFTWWMRLAQGAAAIAAGAWVTHRLRGNPDVVWLAPLAVVVTRLILDPLVLSYYWTPLCILGLVGLGLRRAGDSTAALASAALLAYLPPMVVWTMYGWMPVLVPLLPMLGLVLLQTRLTLRDHPPRGGTPRAVRRGPRDPARPTAPARLLRAGAPSFRAAPTDSTR